MKLDEVLRELVEVLRPPGRPEVQAEVFNCVGPSLTKQSFRDECDINVIMSRYEQTGVLPALNPREPKFGDFSRVEDYHTACNRVLEAQEAFDAMPADVRAHFLNDPALLIEACQDPSRREELARLGLLEVPNGDLVESVSGGVPGGNVAPDAAAGAGSGGGSAGAPGGPGPGGAAPGRSTSNP